MEKYKMLGAVALFLLAACGDDSDPATDAGGASGDAGSPSDAGATGDAGAADAGSDAGAAGPSFATDVFPLFARCQGCHDRGWGSPNAMRAYDALLSEGRPPDPECSDVDERVVVPGDPEASLLIDMLAGTQGDCGERMPALQRGETRDDRPFLTDPEIDVVRAWIAAGALNN